MSQNVCSFCGQYHKVGYPCKPTVPAQPTDAPRVSEEFAKAISYLQQHGYRDWDGTANGQKITLTGCANMMREYARSLISEAVGGHSKHIQRWLTEMYQVMVDPVEEFGGNIEELCALLLKRAHEDREALYQSDREQEQPAQAALAERDKRVLSEEQINEWAGYIAVLLPERLPLRGDRNEAKSVIARLLKKLNAGRDKRVREEAVQRAEHETTRKSMAEDWLNEHKHTWSAHDLFSLIRLLEKIPWDIPRYANAREQERTEAYQRGFAAAKEMAAQRLTKLADDLRNEVPEAMGIAWDVVTGWIKALNELEDKP